MALSKDEDFGKELGLVGKAVKTVRRAGGGRKFWTTLADDVGLCRKIVEFVIPSRERLPGKAGKIDLRKDIHPILALPLDYSLSLEEAIEKGHYELFDGRILKFRILGGGWEQGRGTEQIRLETVDPREVLSDEVLRALSRLDKGVLPCPLPGIRDLLALGAEFPEEQKKFPIIAAGTVFKSGYYDDLYLPCLDYYYSQRRLRLLEIDDLIKSHQQRGHYQLSHFRFLVSWK